MNFIYHGTTAEVARVAFTNGLHPRGESPGNWTDREGLFSANSDWVYLTKDAPLYHAAVSVNRLSVREKTGAVLRLDLDLLDEAFLRPDEDYFYLQGATLRTVEETRQFHKSCREKACQSPQAWKESLAGCGSVGYAGSVPSAAILDAVLIDFQFYATLHAAIAQVGEKVVDRSPVLNLHRQLMNWIYGKNRLSPSIIDSIVEYAAENAEMSAELYNLTHMTAIRNLRNRKGINYRFPTEASVRL